jgi:hypothetical protein
MKMLKLQKLLLSLLTVTLRSHVLTLLSLTQKAQTQMLGMSSRAFSLWVDGDKVAEASASDEDDYLGDEDDGISASQALTS